MGDFSDPREFTEREVREILYDDYMCDGLPPFKALMNLFRDISERRFDYKLQAWGFDYEDLTLIAKDLAREQLNLLKAKVS